MKKLSIGVLLCLMGSINLVEFFHHLDITYLDFEDALILSVYLVLAIPSILFGVPLVVRGLKDVDQA